MLRKILATAFLVFLSACGSSEADKKNSKQALDLTSYGRLSFTKATGLAVSGTRYVYIQSTSELTRYSLNDSGDFAADKSLTLAASQKTSLEGKLKGQSSQSFGTCSDCSSRITIYVEVLDSGSDAFFSANTGNCNCTGDIDKSSLLYSELEAAYDEITSLME